MKAAVLHVNSGNPQGTSPTMRIARFVADELKIPLICSVDTAEPFLKERFDVLFVKYGMLKFSDHRAQALEIYDNARRIVNLENDYTMIPDKRFRKADECWSTVEGRTRYVNWNMLTRHPVDDWSVPVTLPVPSETGLVYYGAFRPDRVASFDRYFKGSRFSLTVSTFRGQKHFAAYTQNVISAFRDPDAPAQWQATLYIEDEKSHELYCSPATRFYECVKMGLAQFIDAKAVNTLRKAGMRVMDEWIVEDGTDLHRALRDWRNVQLGQHVHWYRDYSITLREQFRKACRASRIL